MKQITFLILFLFSVTVFSQNGFYKNGTSVSGNTFNTSTSDLTELLYEKKLYFKNTTSNTITVKFRRLLLCKSPNAGSEQLCYGGAEGICINLNGNDFTSGSWDIPSKDSVQVDLKIQGTGLQAGAEQWLYVLSNFTEQKIDSIKVIMSWGGGTCKSSIDEVSSSYNMNVFPNPVNDVANVELSLYGIDNAELVLVDMLGKIVFNKKVSNSNSIIQINTSNLNQGVYFYSLKSNNEIIETKKMIVKH